LDATDRDESEYLRKVDAPKPGSPKIVPYRV